jgi:hypothetical protein
MIQTTTCKILGISLGGAAFFTAATAGAAQTVVSAIGVNGTAVSTNWLTAGFGTLNGHTAGVNWNNGGYAEGPDWTWNGYGGAGNISVSTEWPAAGTLTTLGYTPGYSSLLIGSSMTTDVSASLSGSGAFLIISEVVPDAATFTLNGVSIVSTAPGQVLQWIAPISALTAGDELRFQSPNSAYGAGTIGFSAAATIPEPSGWAMLLGGAGLLTIRRRRA